MTFVQTLLVCKGVLGRLQTGIVERIRERAQKSAAAWKRDTPVGDPEGGALVINSLWGPSLPNAPG